MSLAVLEGEAGGQAKGESLQLHKSIRELTTELKFKDAEIQKLKDVRHPFYVTYVSLSKSKIRNLKKARRNWQKQPRVRIKLYEMRMQSF